MSMQENQTMTEIFTNFEPLPAGFVHGVRSVASWGDIGGTKH